MIAELQNTNWLHDVDSGGEVEPSKSSETRSSLWGWAHGVHLGQTSAILFKAWHAILQ